SYSKAMPIARTTMITESHWCVLKHVYKYNCNRLHLDRLTQILTKELVSDMEYTWRRYCYNRDLPSCMLSLLRINFNNNPWNNAFQNNNIEAGRSERIPNSNIRTLISAQHTIIESRKAELNEDMK
ncbi:14543_t:CDS:2, partial [Cetraspora pellucida]